MDLYSSVIAGLTRNRLLFKRFLLSQEWQKQHKSIQI